MAKNKKAAAKAGKKAAKNRWKHIIPLVGTTVPTGINIVNGFKRGGVDGAITDGIYGLTGYDIHSAKWEPKNAIAGMIGLGSVGISIAGRKTGINKYIPLPAGWKVF